MLTFQQEPWQQYVRDCQDLWKEHYAEIAVDKSRMPMRPHLDFYEYLERAGMLRILTAREAGVMVGYLLVRVGPHPHYADVLCGFEDSYFMSLRCRRGSAGIRLIKEGIEMLAKQGVKKVFFLTKGFKNLGLIFERLGFELSDVAYSKWIGE